MLTRHGKNPILEPRGFDWEGAAVFNPAAVCLEGRIHLLYRAVGDYWNYASSLGHAVFDGDLELLERDPEPCFRPNPRIWEASVEDARLTEIEGELFMTYVITPTPFPPGGARVRLGIPKRELAITRIGLARVSHDFKRFERLGIITPYDADERDTVLFPGRIGGRYAALHRPSNWIGPDYGCGRPGIWFACLDDLPGRMYGHKLVMAPQEPWESYKIGPGAPPIKTKEGWLLIYHGVDGDRVYRAGAALLDPEEPWRVIARTREPILVPEATYELEGDMPNVVFPEGAVVLGEDLLVFYGGADKVCCAASAPLRKFLKWLLGEGRA
jgi:predicted GH43/DUF377 family glycosyl hydrolase